MSITAGQTASASDFISSSSGAGDSGKVDKLDANGKRNPAFLYGGFGGTGADGALSISSGTTTLSAAGARILTKNYTSISITGTGKLAFSNPHANGTFIFLRSQGNVTLTSSATPMIDHTNMGAAGAAAVSIGASASQAGATGTAGLWGDYICGAGIGGPFSTSPPAAGVFSLVGSTLPTLDDSVMMKYPKMGIGGGGGSGCAKTASGGSATTGAGGNGGGAMVIEVGGTFQFTTANGLSVSGQAGSNGIAGGTNACADGGSGGGGGSLLILYNIAGTITGTVTTTAATGGSGATVGTVSSYTHSSSSGGASMTGSGTAGINRGTDGTGDAGVAGAASTYYLMQLNTYYA